VGLGSMLGLFAEPNVPLQFTFDHFSQDYYFGPHVKDSYRVYKHTPRAGGRGGLSETEERPLVPEALTFLQCSHDLSLAIRMHLLIAFLDLTGPPLHHSLTQPIDRDGNTPLHYCAFYSAKAIADRVVHSIGKEWSTAVLTTNCHGHTPYDIAQLYALDFLEFKDHFVTSEDPFLYSAAAQASAASSAPASSPSSNDLTLRLKQLQQSAEYLHTHERLHQDRRVDLHGALAAVGHLVWFTTGGLVAGTLVGRGRLLSTLEYCVVGFLHTFPPEEVLTISHVVELDLFLLAGWRLFTLLCSCKLIITVPVVSLTAVYLVTLYNVRRLGNLLLAGMAIHSLLEYVIATSSKLQYNAMIIVGNAVSQYLQKNAAHLPATLKIDERKVDRYQQCYNRFLSSRHYERMSMCLVFWLIMLGQQLVKDMLLGGRSNVVKH